MINLNKLLIRILEFINGSGGESTATAIPTAGRVAKFDASAHMNSSDMSSTDISNFVSGVYLNGSPSEYRTLLWQNSSGAGIAPGKISLSLSEYDEVLIEFSVTGSATESHFYSSCKVGSSGTGQWWYINEPAGTNYAAINAVTRDYSVDTTGITFTSGDMIYQGQTFFNWDGRCVPMNIWGIKYERVNPIQAEIADYIVDQGKSGDWTYRKWNSGIAECWGDKNWVITEWTSWSSTYYSTPGGGFSYPTNLFNSAPTVTANVWGSIGDAWFASQAGTAGQGSATITPVYYLMRSSAGSNNITGYQHIYAIGTWK